MKFFLKCNISYFEHLQASIDFSLFLDRADQREWEVNRNIYER